MKFNQINGLGADTTSFDWGSLLDKAVTGYTQITTTKNAAEIAKLNAQAAQAKANYDAQIQYNAALATRNNSPIYNGNAAQEFDIMPFVLIGGAAVLLLFMTK